MYMMKLKPKDKIFMITMAGLISKEEGSRLLNDAKKVLITFNAAEYYFVINTVELKASAQDALEVMQKCLGLFASLPFIKQINITPRSALLKS
ncbi:MAG TPA: hypothetical protein VIK72_15850 [Clostridiaceae bacterium]